ncbi:unnamed protein product, partial [Closterium sp. NIES-53]
VAASSQVFAATSGSGPESAPCSCRLLSHQTLLWHHRLGHPSLPRLRGMASRVLVSGLPRSLPPLPPGPAPTCVPCVEGRQRAAPHSSEFPPTEAPLQTLHMDVGPPSRNHFYSRHNRSLRCIRSASTGATTSSARSFIASRYTKQDTYAGAMAAQELRWLTYLLTDLGEPPRSPPVLYVDNKAMLALCREHGLEHRTKHIALRYFLARELQQRGQLRLAYVASEANTADIFTKALPPGDHQRFCTVLACFALLDWSCDLFPEGFWYSHTIPEAERTCTLVTIQHSAAAETTSAAAKTTSAAAETTSVAAETKSAAAETSTTVATTTTLVLVDEAPPTPAQQLTPAQREVHRSANFTASFYSNSDAYRRSLGHRASEDI